MQLEQPVDLGRRLDVGARVRVEDRLRTRVRARAPRRARGRRRSASSRRRRAERGIVLAATGVRAARVRAAVAEDGPRAAAPAAVEEVERPREAGEVLVEVLGLAEADRAPAAGELEPVPLEPRAQLVALAEVARRPELGPVVARGCDLREQLLRARHVRVHADGQLEGAVRERCVRDPHQAVTSGTRGSFGVSAHVERTHASAGSSDAAIECRSPASAFR